MTTKAKKKNLKPGHKRYSGGSGETEFPGPSQYEFAGKLATLLQPSAKVDNTSLSGNNGNVLSQNGGTEVSNVDLNTRQGIALMLPGMLVEAQRYGLIKMVKGMTPQKQPCIKAVMILSPDGEWSLDGNTISFVGN